MNQEAYMLVEQFVKEHPLTSNEVTIYDVRTGKQWTLLVSPMYLPRALDLFLTAEHAIISHITLDQSATRYLITLPYTMGTVHSGVYTYNTEKDVLE